MKIGIEAQRIFRKNKHGMDMVALELIRNLQQIDKVNEYFIFVRPDEDNTVLKETPNFKIVELEANSFPIWEQIVLPRAAEKFGCEILHCTSNTAPVFCKVPSVVTLHDIIYLESTALNILSGKGTNYQKFGNLYRKLVVPLNMRNSKKIITVSNFEKDCISDFFSVKHYKKLSAEYNGVSDYFKPITDKMILDQIRVKYHLPEQFFFFLGNTHPKKNTKGTLKAFSDFLKETGSTMKLVMLDYDQEELQKLLIEIGDVGLINSIVLTGYINNKDLPAIYSLSQLFLYPSLRESFGIPIIEAMACGVPVITSNTSSMPEIAGNAALLVDPYKSEEITSAMIEVYKNKVLKNKMIRYGIERAAHFSWKSMAENVLNIYRETFGLQLAH
jgi:glycosyltransferase involved in cell wall biosynthesis